MKILIISHEYPPVGGGGSNACRALAYGFAEAGNMVHVLTVRYGDEPAEENLINGKLRITRVNARRHSRDQSSASEMLDYLAKASRKADSILTKGSFDICLCFFGVPGGLLALRLKRKYGLKYIVRMGGGDIPGFQNRFSALYRVVAPFIKEVWKKADALVANSEGLKVMAHNFCSLYPIQVINNGVDTNTYNSAATVTRNDNEIRLLTVCRLIERKGLQDVIPEIANIERQTGKHIHWVIVGDGPYRRELERLSCEAGADLCIEFAGQREKSELPDIYKNADIFVFPSHREGMPNAVLEAMATGLPVVMRADCQGASELIKGNGMTASEPFTDTLVAMINHSKEELTEMGQRSREIVIDNYRWTDITERYLSLMSKATELRR